MATTTPNYGWPVPTSTDYVKDGATAIEALGDAIDATVFGLPSGGLTLVKTQTIGTAVSSVVVTSAFSATYDNYRIIVNGCDSSADNYIAVKFYNSTGSTYKWSNVRVDFASATVLSGQATATTAINIGITGQDNNTNMAFDVINPFATEYTAVTGLNTSTNLSGFYNGIDANAVSQTGFTLLPISGTYTGGTIRVYGYKNS
jgi:hypothetical protein